MGGVPQGSVGIEGVPGFVKAMPGEAKAAISTPLNPQEEINRNAYCC